jgi:hypothetical protein
VKVKKQKDKGDQAKRAAAAARKGAAGAVAQPEGHVEEPEKERVTLDAGGTVADTLKKLHF